MRTFINVEDKHKNLSKSVISTSIWDVTRP